MADQERGEDEEAKRKKTPDAKDGDGEAKGSERRNGKAAGEQLGEEDAWNRAEEDAETRLAARNGAHGTGTLNLHLHLHLHLNPSPRAQDQGVAVITRGAALN